MGRLSLVVLQVLAVLAALSCAASTSSGSGTHPSDPTVVGTVGSTVLPTPGSVSAPLPPGGGPLRASAPAPTPTFAPLPTLISTPPPVPTATRRQLPRRQLPRRQLPTVLRFSPPRFGSIQGRARRRRPSHLNSFHRRRLLLCLGQLRNPHWRLLRYLHRRRLRCLHLCPHPCPLQLQSRPQPLHRRQLPNSVTKPGAASGK